MRRAHALDLAAPIALAAITFGALAALTPARAGARAHTPPTPAAWPTPPSTWTAPAHRPLAPPSPLTRRAAPRRTDSETLEPQGFVSPGGASEEIVPPEELEDFSGLSYDFGLDDHVTYGRRSYASRGRSPRFRSVRRDRSDTPGAFPWVGASSQGAPASLCTLLPSLCGGGGRAARRPATTSPSLVETDTGITLRNDDLAINIARVGACAVRVRRADTGAETLLTFDLPDELVPCEARAVPDVLRDDGVAVRLDAQTPRWSQSVTVSLGDDGPALSVARATREGAVTTHRLVNASAHPVTFTVDGLDLAAAPGERLTVTGS